MSIDVDKNSKIRMHTPAINVERCREMSRNVDKSLNWSIDTYSICCVARCERVRAFFPDPDSCGECWRLQVVVHVRLFASLAFGLLLFTLARVAKPTLAASLVSDLGAHPPDDVVCTS